MEHGLVATLWVSVWMENSLAGRIVIILIVVIGVVAFGRWQQHSRRFRWEERQLLAVIEQLKALRLGAVARGSRLEVAEPGEGVAGEGAGAVEVRPDPGELQAPVEAIALREAAHTDSLIYERLDAIDRLRRQHAKVNLRTLQGLSLARVAARPGLETPARAASTAMMLGIFGTFLGLALMVQGLDLELLDGSGGDSLARNLDNLKGLMGGMKTAFSSSLVGMVAALLLTWLDHRLGDGQAHFFERFERFTIEELLPATVPPLEGKDLLERVSLKLEGSFDRMRDVFESHGDVLESLNGVQSTYLEILDGVRALHRVDHAEQLDEIVSGLGDTQRSVLRVVELLPRLARKMERGQAHFFDQMGSWRLGAARSKESPGFRPGKLLGMLVWMLLAACLFWLLTHVVPIR